MIRGSLLVVLAAISSVAAGAPLEAEGQVSSIKLHGRLEAIPLEGEDKGHCTVWPEVEISTAAVLWFGYGSVERKAGDPVSHAFSRGVSCGAGMTHDDAPGAPSGQSPYLLFELEVTPTLEGKAYELYTELSIRKWKAYGAEGVPEYEETRKHIRAEGHEGEAVSITLYEPVAGEENLAGLSRLEVTLRPEATGGLDRAYRCILRFERVDKATGEVVASTATTASTEPSGIEAEGGGPGWFRLRPPAIAVPEGMLGADYFIEGHVFPSQRPDGTHTVRLQARQRIRMVDEAGWSGSHGNIINKGFRIKPGETVRLDLPAIRGAGREWRGQWEVLHDEHIYLTLHLVR